MASYRNENKKMKELIYIKCEADNKKASRRGGCTNQIPLTIKPYPMTQM